MFENQANRQLLKHLTQPVIRALIGSGITRIADVSRFTISEVLELHGIGPKSISPLEQAMEREGVWYAAE